MTEVNLQNMPEILKAAGGLPIFMIQGNADAFSFFHIQENRSEYPSVKALEAGVHEWEGFRVFGLGGVEANDAGSINVNKFNPKYGGVFSGEVFSGRIDALCRLTSRWRESDWRRTIMMTHQPAEGFVDVFGGKHAGSSLVEKLVRRTYPLLHLAGHVHDAVADVEKDEQTGKDVRTYRPDRTREIIDGKTLTVNIGGGFLHDPEVRMWLIDLDALVEKGVSISAGQEA